MVTQLPVLGVKTYVQHHLPRYIEELRTLCAIDSNSYYKPGLDTIASYLAARLHGLGRLCCKNDDGPVDLGLFW